MPDNDEKDNEEREYNNEVFEPEYCDCCGEKLDNCECTEEELEEFYAEEEEIKKGDND